MGGDALHCIQHTCIIYIYAFGHLGYFPLWICFKDNYGIPFCVKPMGIYNILTTFQILMYDHGQPSCSSFWRPHVVHCAEVHLGDMASCKLDRVLKSMHCLGAPKVHLVGPFLDEHGCHID